MPSITPFLWFDGDVEEALTFYTELFPDSEIIDVSRYGEGAPAPAGTVLTATFRIAGQTVMILNGGPQFTHTEAFSFFVQVETQDELDRYWDALVADGGEESMCGWLKDRFGLSWQIVPSVLGSLLGDPDQQKAGRAMQAMLGMRRLDIDALRRAHAGE